jgi:PadR family transcriptional regulator, regulatory protein PadR
MKVENTIAQMKKGVLEMCILSILSHKEAYPSDIISELRAADLRTLDS